MSGEKKRKKKKERYLYSIVQVQHQNSLDEVVPMALCFALWDSCGVAWC